MEGNTESSTGEKTAGGRSKTPGIPTSTRLQRNQAEKQRRDRLNGYISELANLVPMVSNASKPLDKVSILRLSAAQMRLNFSCLNPKKYKSKPLTLPPSVMSYLDVIEKSIGGFIIVTTFSGCIVFCSKSIEDYVGYQNIDVMGNSVYSYIHTGDATYFQKKVNSVTNSQRKGSKKKTKVIKAHMQQRPLPRSNDIRYRKMIFKISLHLNDSEELNGNGHSHLQSKTKKKGRSKDFGSSAVVLMFIEPVRLEPEIDISYIESHQDAYFTMHGLQGEIIYADQRISTITGYMPHDVQGTSAYQYICSSDVPIALFAQKAMFTSNDGTGVIVYRLRIRDMRYIYLQSSGQIAYKDSTNDISHFVCFNKLLSDEEGSQELKKFQQRFAPQMVQEKIVQGKKNNINIQAQNTNVPTDPSSVPLLNSSSLMPQENVIASQLTSYRIKTNTSEDVAGITDKTSSDNCISPSSSAIVSCSVHSSERHSLTSPISDGRSSSVVSEYSGLHWSFDASSERFSEQLQLTQDQQERRSSLNSDCSSHTVLSYQSINSTASGNSVISDNFEDHIKSSRNDLDHSLIVDTSRIPENNVNGSFMMYQKSPCTSDKLQNGTISANSKRSSTNSTVSGNSVISENFEDQIKSSRNGLDHSLIVDTSLIPENNVNGSFMMYQKSPCTSDKLQNGTISANSITINDVLEQSLYSNSMELDFDYAISQKDVFENVDNPRNVFSDQSAILVSNVSNGHQGEYVNYNGEVPYESTAEKDQHFINSTNEQLLDLNSTALNPLPSLQEIIFPGKQAQCSNGFSNFTGMYEVSQPSSLNNISNHLPNVIDIGDAVNISDLDPYENGSYTNNYLPKSVSCNGVNRNISIGKDIYKSEPQNRNSQQVNGCHRLGIYNVIPNFSSGDMINSVQTTVLNQAAISSAKKNAYCRTIPRYPGNDSLKLPIRENGSSDLYSANVGLHTNLTNGSKLDIRADELVLQNVESDLNKELYNELDLFFKNFSHTPLNPVVTKTVPKFSVANNYQENSISSIAKTKYHL